MQDWYLRLPCGACASPEPKRMILGESEEIRTSLVHEGEPARGRRVPRVRRNQVHRDLQLRFRHLGDALSLPGRFCGSPEVAVPLRGRELLQKLAWIFGSQSHARIAVRYHTPLPWFTRRPLFRPLFA